MTGSTSKYQIRDTKNGKSNQSTGGDCEQKPIEPRTSSRNFQQIFCEVLLKNRMRRLLCGARHMQHDTSSLFLRGGMYRNSTYQIEASSDLDASSPLGLYWSAQNCGAADSNSTPSL
jgi:hypothetical protein